MDQKELSLEVLVSEASLNSTMSPTIGSMGPFVEGEEEFESYAQRCENFF